MNRHPISLDSPTILDTTLRDGSYAINFQFTAADTYGLCHALEEAGLPLIEIGHGVGLGASKAGFGEAAETDEAYCQAAADALEKAQYGAFCIPGIASLADIDMAVANEMGFLRVGTDVHEVAQSREFIERARTHEMFVCANFMKSYAVPPTEFVRYAKESVDYGAQAIYVVDSAGGMLPDELKGYLDAMSDIEVPFAFHGHNNMGLAVGNSLSALQSGAMLIDGSLLGIGRSAGNAPTEQLIASLQRSGLAGEMDLLKVLDIGSHYIKPLMAGKAWQDLDLVIGYALFHSSYMKTIGAFASRYNVDPRKLIIEVCKRDKVNADPDMVDEIAKALSKEETSGVSLARYGLHQYHGSEQQKGL